MSVTALQTQFRDEFIQSFERKKSILVDTATPEIMIQGGEAVFLVAGSGGVQALERGNDSRIPSLQGINTQISVPLKEAHAKFGMTSFDIFASQANQRAIMNVNSTTVINRKIDDVIIDALLGSTNGNVTATGVNNRIIGDIFADLYDADVPNDGNTFALITPRLNAALEDIPAYASADFNNIKPLVDGAATEGRPAKFWRGCYWMMHTGMPGRGTNSETNFFYHRNAIGYAYDKQNIEATTPYDEIDKIHYSIKSIKQGCKLLQNNGVYKFLFNPTA